MSATCHSTRGLLVPTALLFALAPSVRCVDPVWNLVSSAGPRSRDGHAMTYDTYRKVVILFGGHYIEAGHKYLNDTWEWDGAAWKQVASTGPGPRAEHAMAFDAVRRRVVLFGGLYFDTSGHRLRDTWEWDGTAWTQVSSTGPVARYGHAMDFHALRRTAMLFGGSGEGVSSLSDFWEWDGTSWKQVTGAGPSGRINTALVWDGMRSRMVLFGGDHYDSGLAKWVRLNDTWYWDRTTSAWQQQSPTTSPPIRASHVMAPYGWPWSLVAFGGVDGATSFSDTWMMDGSTWRQASSSGPYGGSYTAMAYDEARDRIVLFGINGETWILGKAPFTLGEVAQALAIAGGLTSPSPETRVRLDVEPSGPLEQVDIRDAALMARKVAGLEANP